MTTECVEKTRPKTTIVGVYGWQSRYWYTQSQIQSDSVNKYIEEKRKNNNNIEPNTQCSIILF